MADYFGPINRALENYGRIGQYQNELAQRNAQQTFENENQNKLMGLREQQAGQQTQQFNFSMDAAQRKQKIEEMEFAAKWMTAVKNADEAHKPEIYKMAYDNVSQVTGKPPPPNVPTDYQNGGMEFVDAYLSAYPRVKEKMVETADMGLQPESQAVGKSLYHPPVRPSSYEQRKADFEKDPAKYTAMVGAGKNENPQMIDMMTQGALDAAAARYGIDGTLPSLGMGKNAAILRTKILNRWAEMSQDTGMDPEQQRIFQINTSANKSALTNLSKQNAMVGAFEKNFVANADLVLSLSNKFDSGGIPLLNKWIQVGKRSLTGDPELSKLDVAIKATVNEYSKIISGSMGNTVLAEGEIKKVESLLNSAQTPQQVSEVISFMKTETQNRMKGFSAQQKELKSGMALPKGNKQTATSDGPTIGTIDSGFQFNGGDPADPKNWNQVQ